MKRHTSLQMVTPSDVPAIWRIAREQNEENGTDIAVPRIFDEDDRQMENIPLALKVMDGGCLVQAHIFECQPELLTFGVSRRGTKLSLAQLPAALWFLESLQRGYTGFHALAPVSRLEEWERTWGKRLNLVRDDSRVAHYYRDFREGRE